MSDDESLTMQQKAFLSVVPAGGQARDIKYILEASGLPVGSIHRIKNQLLEKGLLRSIAVNNQKSVFISNLILDPDTREMLVMSGSERLRLYEWWRGLVSDRVSLNTTIEPSLRTREYASEMKFQCSPVETAGTLLAGLLACLAENSYRNSLQGGEPTVMTAAAIKISMKAIRDHFIQMGAVCDQLLNHADLWRKGKVEELFGEGFPADHETFLRLFYLTSAYGSLDTPVGQEPSEPEPEMAIPMRPAPEPPKFARVLTVAEPVRQVPTILESLHDYEPDEVPPEDDRDMSWLPGDPVET